MGIYPRHDLIIYVRLQHFTCAKSKNQITFVLAGTLRLLSINQRASISRMGCIQNVNIFGCHCRRRQILPPASHSDGFWMGILQRIRGCHNSFCPKAEKCSVFPTSQPTYRLPKFASLFILKNGARATRATRVSNTNCRKGEI